MPRLNTKNRRVSIATGAKTAMDTAMLNQNELYTLLILSEYASLGCLKLSFM